MSIDTLRGVWRGQTIACIASGPSLHEDDVGLIQAAGMPTIVVNNCFRIAPWADVLYAMDSAWWRHYGGEALRSFPGDKLSYVPIRMPGVSSTKGQIFPTGWGNSGSYAISVGVITGAKRIILIGYDCSLSPDGRAHWHEDHPNPMGNATSIATWPRKFALVSNYARSHGCLVINCSRHTELKCFVRSTLAEQLEKVAA